MIDSTLKSKYKEIKNKWRAFKGARYNNVDLSDKHPAFIRVRDRERMLDELLKILDAANA